MNTNFASSLAHVLSSEGGYCDYADDPGGATDEGVTQHQYDLWRIAHQQPTQDVRGITPDEINGIYRGWYWDTVQGDQLPSGVDYCVFDGAVNSGPHRSAQWLQQAAGVASDGRIGPATLAAVTAADPRRIINGICTARLAFLESLPTWGHFGNGWNKRVASVEITARGMA